MHLITINFASVREEFYEIILTSSIYSLLQVGKDLPAIHPQMGWYYGSFPDDSGPTMQPAFSGQSQTPKFGLKCKPLEQLNSTGLPQTQK